MELMPPVSDVVMLAFDVGNGVISEPNAIEQWASCSVVLNDEQILQISQTQLRLLQDGLVSVAWVLAKLVVAAAARQSGQARESPWWQAADEFVAVTRVVLCRAASGRRLSEALEIVDLQLNILRERLDSDSLHGSARASEEQEYFDTLLAAGRLITEPYLLHSGTGSFGLRRWISNEMATEVTLPAEVGQRYGYQSMMHVREALMRAEGYFLEGAGASVGHLKSVFLGHRLIARERRFALAAEQGKTLSDVHEPRDVVVYRLAGQALDHFDWRKAPALFMSVLRLQFDSAPVGVDRERHAFMHFAEGLNVHVESDGAVEAVSLISNLVMPSLSRSRLDYLWRTVASRLPEDYPASGRALLCETVVHCLPENVFLCPPNALSKDEAELVAERICSDPAQVARAKSSSLVHLAFHLADGNGKTAIKFLLKAESIDDTLSSEFFDCIEYARLRVESRSAAHREKNNEIFDALLSYAAAATEAADLHARWRWPELTIDLMLRTIDCFAEYRKSDNNNLPAIAVTVASLLLRQLTIASNQELAGPIELMGISLDRIIRHRSGRGGLVLLHHQLFKGAEFGLAAATASSYEMSTGNQLLFKRLADHERRDGPYVATNDAEIEGNLESMPSGLTSLAFANFYEIVPVGADDHTTGTMRRAIDDGIAVDLVLNARRKRGFPDQLFNWEPRQQLQKAIPSDTVLVSLYVGERDKADITDENSTAILTCTAITQEDIIAWSVVVNAFGGKISIYNPDGRIRALPPFAFQVAEAREAINADPLGRPVTPSAQKLLKAYYSQLGGPPAMLLERWWREGRRHLCFWPHGPLHYVPFALLEVDEEPLGNKWTITTVPSDVLLVRSNGAESNTKIQFAAVGSGRGGVELGLQPQQMVEDHVHDVAGNFPGSEVLVGPQATPDNVMKAMKRSTHLHIAAHGSHDGEASWFQCLYMDAAGTGDGRLFAYDILQLDLRHVRLVTLSACESAMGRYDRNDSLRGLPAAFLLAGAETVIGTLWPIAPTVATTFFGKLYKKLAENPDKRSAYRAAQCATRASYPAYRDWGAFTYIGV